MSFEVSSTTTHTFFFKQDNDFKKLPQIEKFFETLKDKFSFSDKPSIEKPDAPTWPGANSMMSNIGEIMLLLAKVGIALRDQQREQTKLHHDSAVSALEKSAEHTREQAKAAFITAAVSFVVSVGMAGMGLRAQKASNAQMSKAYQLDKQATQLKSEMGRLQQKQGALNKAETEIMGKANAKVSSLQDDAMAAQLQGGWKTTVATNYSQGIMASGQIIGGVGQGAQQLIEAESKEMEAVSQTHQKASDLASQDYQEMEKFRGNIVNSLKEIVNMLNEIVKTTTQV